MNYAIKVLTAPISLIELIKNIQWLFSVRFILFWFLFCLSFFLMLLRGIFSPFTAKSNYFFAKYCDPFFFRLLGMKVEVVGWDQCTESTPAVFVGNHQHHMDAFVYSSLIVPKGVCIGKDSVKWYPFFGWAFWVGGNILIKRTDRKNAKNRMLKARDEMLKNEKSIYILPEGTRNHGNGLLPFKKGAFLLAIDTQRPLVPISINTYSKGMNFNRWESARVQARIHPPISTEGLTRDDFPQLAEKARQIIEDGIEKLDSGL